MYFGHLIPWGLVYSQKSQLYSLPLLSTSVNVSIVDLAVSVSLVQEYHNNFVEAVEVSYSFPIPNRAAVSSFALTSSNGTKLLGVVHEKAEAREKYNKAVKEGKMAALLEEQTPDGKHCFQRRWYRCQFTNVVFSLPARHWKYSSWRKGHR
jgi:hypothetical protein